MEAVEVNRLGIRFFPRRSNRQSGTLTLFSFSFSFSNSLPERLRIFPAFALHGYIESSNCGFSFSFV